MSFFYKDNTLILGLVCAFAVIILDQFSKYAVLNWWLGENVGIRICDVFNIVRAWNTGVSFSMFNNYGHAGAYILSAAAIAIVIMLFYWLKSEKNNLSQIALGLIMGGALGNVIDRLRFGAVFDFLDFHLGDSHWPAFNVADSCICIGAAIIIAQAFIIQLKNKKEK